MDKSNSPMNLTKMRNMFKLLPFIYRGFKFENHPGCRFTCLKRSLKTMEMFIFMSSLASGNPNSSGKKHLFGKNLLLNMQKVCSEKCFRKEYVFLMIFVGLFQRCFFAFWWFSWVTLVDQKVRNTTCSGVSILRQRSRVRVKKSEAILPLVDQEQTTMTWEYWSNIDVAEPRASWCGTCFWVLLWFTILWTPYEMGYCRQMCLKIINQQDQH